MIGNILADKAVYLKYRLLILLVERGKHESAVQKLRTEKREYAADKKSAKGKLMHYFTAGIC